jgi:hypothetical protein
MFKPTRRPIERDQASIGLNMANDAGRRTCSSRKPVLMHVQLECGLNMPLTGFQFVCFEKKAAGAGGRSRCQRFEVPA